MIKITIDSKNLILRAEGHSDTIVCASVTLFFDLAKFICSDSVKTLYIDGLSEIKFQDLEEFALWAGFLEALQSKYPNQSTLITY